MTPEDRPGPRWLIPLLASFTGAAALVYEVSWSRQIGLVLGQTPRTGALVLISFFGGLAIGQILAGRLAGRGRPVLLYGLSEFCVGIGSALVPFALEGAARLQSPGWSSVLCAAALLPATVSLGLTWPFLAAWAREGRDDRSIAFAYAVNTVGGLIGVVLSSAFLLVELGVVASNWLASATSTCAGLMAIAAARRSPPLFPSSIDPEIRPRPSIRAAFPLYVLALSSGILTLGLQSLATHLFSLVFHNSTYTFSIIVAVSLASLAIGSALAGSFGPSPEDRVRIGALAGLAGVVLGVSLLGFTHGRGLGYVRSWAGFGVYLLQATALVSLVLGPATVLLGMILPSAWIAGSRAGLSIGRLAAVNSVGAASGAWLAEFVSLPLLGLWRSLAALVLLTGLVSTIALAPRRRTLAGLGVLGAATLASILAATPSLLRTLPRGSFSTIESSWQGPHGLLEIVRVSSRERVLRLNLHYGLGATGDSAYREFRQGHLPLLLHPGPRNVLFLGLGTGLTAASALEHDGLEAIEVVELIPEVILAARALSEENLHLLDDPRVSVRVDDARHALRRPSPLHDVIVSDLFVPWESRTGYLYTADFYRQCRLRLAPGGLFCQWLPLYQLGGSDFELIAESFSTGFPHTSLWWGQLSSDQPILALIGSNNPITLDPATLDARLSRLRRTVEPADDPYLGSATSLARLCFGSRPPAGGATNTDEHPRVEFRAPIHHGSSTLLRRDLLLDWFDRTARTLAPFPIEGSDARRSRAWQRSMILHDDPRGTDLPRPSG